MYPTELVWRFGGFWEAAGSRKMRVWEIQILAILPRPFGPHFFQNEKTVTGRFWASTVRVYTREVEDSCPESELESSVFTFQVGNLTPQNLRGRSPGHGIKQYLDVLKNMT